MNISQEQIWNRIKGKLGNYYQEASDSERADFCKWIRGLLNSGRVYVNFTKSDGSEREMLCTTSEDFGARYKTVGEDLSATDTDAKPPKPQNKDVCKVWDCEAKAWRSFRWDRLLRIKFPIG